MRRVSVSLTSGRRISFRLVTRCQPLSDISLRTACDPLSPPNFPISLLATLIPFLTSQSPLSYPICPKRSLILDTRLTCHYIDVCCISELGWASANRSWASCSIENISSTNSSLIHRWLQLYRLYTGLPMPVIGLPTERDIWDCHWTIVTIGSCLNCHTIVTQLALSSAVIAYIDTNLYGGTLVPSFHT